MKIFHLVDKKFHKAIKKNAKTTGLDKIGPERFHLYKVGDKKNPKKDVLELIETGFVSIIGDSEFVWISVFNMNTWCKTSPVLKCDRYGSGWRIETENSFYELKEV